MRREIWEDRTFSSIEKPIYPCPNCDIGLLELGPLKREPTGDIQDYWLGEENIFSGILKCKNEKCGAVISIGGSCFVDYRDVTELINGELSSQLINLYEPKFFYPNLKMFPLSKNVPEKVREQVNLSFSSYFNDLSSSANRIRNAIELILDEAKAPKFEFRLTVSRCPISNDSCSRHSLQRLKEKKYFRNLHQRIENYSKKKNRSVGELLMANKVIGNEGSHIGKLETKDLLDAYEILEEILNILFVKGRQEIQRKAKEISISKKPRSHKE